MSVTGREMRLIRPLDVQDLHDRFNKYGKEEWDY